MRNLESVFLVYNDGSKRILKVKYKCVRQALKNGFLFSVLEHPRIGIHKIHKYKLVEGF